SESAGAVLQRPREASIERDSQTLTIVNEAFNSRPVRYQDAPEICSLWGPCRTRVRPRAVNGERRRSRSALHIHCGVMEHSYLQVFSEYFSVCFFASLNLDDSLGQDLH